MKSILVPVEDIAETSAILECALAIATRFAGLVDGIGLRPMQFQVVGAEPIVAVTFPPADENAEAAIGKARAAFDAFVRAAPDRAARMRWRPGDSIDDNGLGALARVYDLSVVGRPNTGGQGPRMTTLEAVLFDSGRPILIAPPKTPSSVGENVVISWNCSMEAAHTLAFALPILERAREVHILTVESAVAPGPSGAEVKDYLAGHDIKAANVVVSGSGGKPGAVILAEATRLGADLLVKGAYTQSRLRQMIFGGATSHILANAELPVFMAN